MEPKSASKYGRSDQLDLLGIHVRLQSGGLGECLLATWPSTDVWPKEPYQYPESSVIGSGSETNLPVPIVCSTVSAKITASFKNLVANLASKLYAL